MITQTLPWRGNILTLPYYTGQRHVFLPFNMFPGHRGYGPIPAMNPGALPGTPFNMAFGGGNPLFNLIPLFGSLLGGLFGGAAQAPAQIKTSSVKLARKDDNEVVEYLRLLVHPLAWHPVLLGTALGSLGGALYMRAAYKKRLKDRPLLDQITSAPVLFGLLTGGITGGSFGLAADQLARFMRDA